MKTVGTNTYYYYVYVYTYIKCNIYLVFLFGFLLGYIRLFESIARRSLHVMCIITIVHLFIYYSPGAHDSRFRLAGNSQNFKCH